MILRIFDVSEYIYAGRREDEIVRLIEDRGPYRTESLPVGGVKHLLKTIKQFDDGNTVLVYCLDRPPMYKRELFNLWWPSRGGYKGTRGPKKEDIIIQQSLVEDILNMLGVNVLVKDNYEADDMIANVVEHYADSFDKVYIHARDSDMHYLVRDNVEIMPIGTLGKHITVRNYETEVDNDYKVKYNMKVLWRMARGGKDNVPSISKEDYNRIYSNLDKDAFATYGDLKKLEQVILNSCGKGEAWRVFRIIAPWQLSQDDVMLYEQEIKYKRLQGFIDLLNNKLTSIDECNTLIDDYLSRYGRR